MQHIKNKLMLLVKNVDGEDLLFGGMICCGLLGAYRGGKYYDVKYYDNSYVLKENDKGGNYLFSLEFKKTLNDKEGCDKFTWNVVCPRSKNYSYTDKVMWSVFGFALYVCPYLCVLPARKEVRRLEIYCRGLEDERNDSRYYNLI